MKEYAIDNYYDNLKLSLIDSEKKNQNYIGDY